MVVGQHQSFVRYERARATTDFADTIDQAQSVGVVNKGRFDFQTDSLQIQLIQPEFICCMGRIAAQNLLNTTEAVGRLRGRLHNWHDIGVVCTYHPAYLLRAPEAKAKTWEDMKLLMRAMGIEIKS